MQLNSNQWKRLYNNLIAHFPNLQPVIHLVYHHEQHYKDEKTFVIRILHYLQLMFRLSITFITIQTPDKVINVDRKLKYIRTRPMILCKQMYDLYFKPEEIPYLYCQILYPMKADWHPNFKGSDRPLSRLYLDQKHQNKLSELSLIYQKWQQQSFDHVSSAEMDLQHIGDKWLRTKNFLKYLVINIDNYRILGLFSDYMNIYSSIIKGYLKSV